VRETLASYDDPGWYVPPAGTLAEPALSEDLSRDGIDAAATTAPAPAAPSPAVPAAAHGHGGHTGHGAK
jgi:hypothetical protein